MDLWKWQVLAKALATVGIIVWVAFIVSGLISAAHSVNYLAPFFEEKNEAIQEGIRLLQGLQEK